MRVHELPDFMLVEVCERFLAAEKADDIKEWVNAELPKLHFPAEQISREQVYSIIRLARKRGFFFISPPEDTAFGDRVANRYGVPRSEVQVVSSRKALEPVAHAAARTAVQLIEQLASERDELTLGVGGGRTTRLVVRHLASLLRTAKRLPKLLTIHTLSTGFDVFEPDTVPLSYFSFFEGISIEIKFVGLFATAIVETKDYARIKKLPGVKEAYAAIPKDGFDIVITSLGSASHPHGDFSRFMASGSSKGLDVLRKNGWVGDVQYRPYSNRGPIGSNTFVRTVTLLELKDLVALARRPDKHVIVVAGPCGQCGGSRCDAVYPLFASKKLKLWSRFVMDLSTAQELIDWPAAPAAD